MPINKIIEDDTDYLNIKIVKHSKEEFSSKVIELVKETNISYLDAVLEMVEFKKIEIEIVAKLITPELKELIEKEAFKNNLLKND